MAKAKERAVIAEYPVSEVIAPVPDPQLCENCAGWNSNNSIYGQCMPSGKFLSAPMVTTNRTSCKNWSKRA